MWTVTLLFVTVTPSGGASWTFSSVVFVRPSSEIFCVSMLVSFDKMFSGAATSIYTGSVLTELTS